MKNKLRPIELLTRGSASVYRCCQSYVRPEPVEGFVGKRQGFDKLSPNGIEAHA